MNLRVRLLRFLLPEQEKTRMEMREMRCRTEASAEDLSRTIITDAEKIREMVRKRRVNGGHK